MSVLVTKKAPQFKATAVMQNGTINENFSLSDYEGKYIVLFFWPLDFTFVCPTEIIAHDKEFEQFKDKDVQLIGISIDSPYSHFAWREMPLEKGGIGKTQFPLVADLKHQIAQAYGIEHPEEGVALRASFLIDKEGIVRHQVVNDLPLGRSVEEMLRMVDALQYFEENGEVCPANWKPGEKAMKATSEGVADYLTNNQ